MALELRQPRLERFGAAVEQLVGLRRAPRPAAGASRRAASSRPLPTARRSPGRRTSSQRPQAVQRSRGIVRRRMGSDWQTREAQLAPLCFNTFRRGASDVPQPLSLAQFLLSGSHHGGPRCFSRRPASERKQPGSPSSQTTRATMAESSIAVAPAAPSGADLRRAEKFAREPFVLEGEDAADALAEGTARRRAFDAAIAEIEAGRDFPSIDWRREYALILGLERVLADEEPQARRRHGAQRPPGRRPVGHADRAYRGRPRPPPRSGRNGNGGANGKARRGAAERRARDRGRRGGRRRTRSRSTGIPPRRPRRRPPPTRRPTRTRTPTAASGSSTRPAPARPSPRSASSRPPAPAAS